MGVGIQQMRQFSSGSRSIQYMPSSSASCAVYPPSRGALTYGAPLIHASETNQPDIINPKISQVLLSTMFFSFCPPECYCASNKLGMFFLSVCMLLCVKQTGYVFFCLSECYCASNKLGMFSSVCLNVYCASNKLGMFFCLNVTARYNKLSMLLICLVHLPIPDSTILCSLALVFSALLLL